MKNTLLTASMLAYLSCAAPKETVQVPVVEVSGDSITIVERNIRTEELPKDSPAKKAADFIVKTLEEKIKENPGTKYVRGGISIYGSHIYYINYKFDPADLCEVSSGKKLFKGSLSLDFRDWFYVANGTSSQTIMDFELVPHATTFRYLHGEYPGNGSSISKSGIYPAFPEAQKMLEEMLLYIAEELKKPLKIEFEPGAISILHPDVVLGNQKEENILKGSYTGFIKAFPEQQPYPTGAKVTLVKACNP